MTASQFDKTKSLLDNVSPSFCLAKWSQVTMRLSDGFNHSCYNPPMHKISISEIEKNPSALHNTSYKKNIRQQMVDGIKPKECNICWTDEEAGGYYSDRIKKSSQEWALPYYNQIIESPMADINPAYLEVIFDNTCNLKCSYCSPASSSKWTEEIKQFGPYPTSESTNSIDGMEIIKNKEDNPYTDAFWKWWPNLYSDLKVLRISGGEPLLSKHTFKLLDKLIKNPNTNLEFAINSNLSVPDILIDKLIEKLNQLNVKNITVYTSCEGYGPRAEYSRYGLDYIKWFSNCEKILNNVNCKMYVIASYNVFSPTSYTEFINDTARLRSKNFYIDTNYVRLPFYLSMFILDDSFNSYFESHLKAFEHNKASFFEMNGMKRLLSLFRNRNIDTVKVSNGRKNFVKFVDEYDRRRGTDFLETFPEMEQFYFTCLKPS